MNTTTRLLLSIAFLLITAHRLPAPIQEIPESPTPTREKKSKPPFETKQAQSAKTSLKRAASTANQEVRVILSENTRMSIVHLKTYVETGEKIPFAPKSDVNPEEITERLRQVLSTRFRNVSILSEGSGSRSANGLTLLFDVQARVGMTSGETNSVVLSATFKDGTGHVIDTITASGSTKVPYPAWRTHFPEALAAAYGEFSQKLSRLRE